MRFRVMLCASVEVMLFADRLEICNPGRSPESLTFEALRQAHSSVPWNPLMAEPMYLTQYIERMSTGTGDMIRRCVEAGLPEPQFGYRDGFVLSIFGPRLREFESSGKSSGNMRQKILRMIGNDAEITTAEMASRPGVTQRTVEKQVRMLREEGVPGRAGPAKGGHWALME
jgi:predicted HTH transcriptional regulator